MLTRYRIIQGQTGPFLEPDDGGVGTTIQPRQLVYLASEVDRALAWQPIDTAPKDRELLLWDGFDVVTGQWIDHGDGLGEWDVDQVCAEEPTHWMPLPEAP